MNRALSGLSAAELRDRLISFTVGGGREINFDKAGEIFSEYILRALPGTQVLGVQPFRTAAALNSIAGLVRIRRQKGAQEVFAKIHIESGTKSVSAVGVEGEYRNAQLLISAGWPVLSPLEVGVNKDYPLLLYPKTDAATLFQLLERSYAASQVLLTQEDVRMVEKLNQQVGGATRQTLGQIDRMQAADAPVQNLFLKRFVAGGRIDQWYVPETEFRLPGIDKPVPWEKINNAQWIINGEKFGTALHELIAKARKSLSFQGEDAIAAAVSHGDDHAGNVFMDKKSDKAVVFDPAFAGLNPISLCDLKAFAHTGFLPMAGLYYTNPPLKSYRNMVS